MARPADGKPIWTFSRTIDYPIEKVEGILFDIKTGYFSKHNAPVILAAPGSGHIDAGSNTYTIHNEDGSKIFLFVNKERHSLTIKGQWWYSGTYTVEAEGDFATKITLEVRNVAKKFGWAANLMRGNKKKNHKENFDDLISALVKRMM